MDVPDRVRWAVALLDPRPGQRILELGCGPGVAAEAVCARGAAVLALDRSATAVSRTAVRCAGYLDAGLLEVRQGTLADLADDRFDAAFAVDVNLFWRRSPAAELAVLHRVLCPGGMLHVCFGAGGPQGPERLTVPVAAALRAAGFAAVRVRVEAEGLAVSGVREDR
jgi:SAM-dependent methyltransferase